jgi:hypothetical protein
MNSVAAIKDLVLEMMESVFQAPDINATQQLGVQMSNAVREKGVVIIQNQNVEVLGRLMPQMIKVLKICDSIPAIDITPRALPPPPIEIDAEADEDEDPIDECCRWMFENNINWDAMQDLIKARYLEYVVAQFKTKTEAAKMLGVGATYLCKLTKPKEAPQ